ncbi:MAG: hypothetical protein II603_10285, partial [Muribaculaceae bacterium]|nr:hypothetical protein [Muribaculaceae bacterium]
MDKNTVIGMLLMCAVIFGFMYCQSNNKETQQAGNKQSSKTEKNNKSNQAATIDSLSQDDWATLTALVAKNDSAINDGGVNIKQEGGKLTGSVKVGSSTVSIDSINTNVNAVEAVRTLITKYNQALMFSGCHKGSTQTVTLRNDSIKVEI